MSHIKTLLQKKSVLLMDGATGTMLQAKGMPPDVNPAVFCLERPDVVRAVITAYAEAGANIVLTPTFGGTTFKLPARLDPTEFNRRMAETVREAVRSHKGDRPLFVAGDMGPTGRFMKPLGDLPPQELVEGFRAQVRGLAQGGVDLILIETQFDLAEVRAAVAAVRMECDLPVLASMTFEDGVSLTGSTPEIFAATMSNMGIDAVGVNCGAGPEEMVDVVRRLLAACNLPVFAEPNAGLPELINGETVFRLAPEPFAEKTAAIAALGARLVGGCCGTTPEHIFALRKAVEALPEECAARPAAPRGVALTSRSALLRIGPDHDLALIGERINPTGKKTLAAEMLAGQWDMAMRFAVEQMDAGAQALDVNVGAPGVDEAACLPALVQSLVARCQTPLSLDSPNPDALTAALPFHPGSALINSISGETGRMEKLAPLCRIWGSPYVLLPLQGGALPATTAERIAIIESLLQRAEGYGLPPSLALVDVLALTAASDPTAPRQCLETIAWCVEHGLATTIGLSNISFGLPARDLVNSAFFAMAAGAGLNSCIGNPGNVRLREALDTARLLLGKDAQAGRFIARYAGWKPGEGGVTAAVAEARGKLTLEDAVIRGEKEAIIPLVDEALSAGADPFELVRGRLIPAITEVGARYERKEYFLPQLLRSAETMQAAFAHVKPLLERSSASIVRKKVVLATVEGDIHDIGKNIVALLLGNHGFEVIDLGKDVKAAAIVAAAQKEGADIIGLSALMTTTMPRMEETLRLARHEGLSCPVMVGGAVVTREYASSIGAEYSADAVEAVRVATALTA